MIKFFYDSLETLQKVTFPTKKDYINLTISVFVVVILSGLFFIAVDSILSGAYKTLYSTMRSDAPSELEQQILGSGLTVEEVNDKSLNTLSGIVLDDVEIEPIVISGDNQ